MAVQPMKSIAGVALAADAGEYTVEAMLAAGLTTAAFVTFLGAAPYRDPHASDRACSCCWSCTSSSHAVALSIKRSSFAL